MVSEVLAEDNPRDHSNSKPDTWKLVDLFWFVFGLSSSLTCNDVHTTSNDCQQRQPDLFLKTDAYGAVSCK